LVAIVFFLYINHIQILIHPSSRTAIWWILLEFAKVFLVPLFESLFLSFGCCINMYFSWHLLSKAPFTKDMVYLSIVIFYILYHFTINSVCFVVQPCLELDSSFLMLKLTSLDISGDLPLFVLSFNLCIISF
jgi:hypothetical protein